MTSSPSVARHRAPENTEVRIASPQDVVRTGRHAEPEWAREAHDPQRDGDPFEWLGFRAVG
ncbi:hypothetical protein [Petropleomorpha daqingensis]|uniref:Uncharacterized protein n=1 Tax=Petropleomorpha daqingensis TaxID=2026353 RepID=A0A853CJY5_9ACTN|nr:hypothetical protein [Petropleomorpha daqingensis]NYJ06832.1 hypothetical protein [Petropleomorpha daqingensis]